MSSHLNAEQRELRNAEEYRRKLGTLHQAAVGVVLTRTREPFRLIDTLRDFAFGEGMPFKVWTLIHGWATYDPQNPAQPETDGMVDAFGAVKLINAIGGGSAWPNGIYVMVYPHWMLSKNPGMMMCIKEYSRLFNENKKRLILVTPTTYDLPTELEDDIAILDYETPSYAELSTGYDKLLTSLRSDRVPQFSDEDKDRILAAGAGMTNHEFENAVARSFITNRDALPNAGIEEIAGEVMKVKTEVVKRSDVLEVMPAVPMADVGGLENLKDWVSKRTRCFSQDAVDFGIESPRGILCVGPPGTGKSLVAKAIASTLGLPLVRFDVSRVFNSLVGQSEQRVRSALQMVDAMAPCVLFIDEIDKALGGTHNSSGDSGVGKRVLGSLLTWLQESKSPVFAVFTANRVDALPAELLRRGRLDEVFSVTIPNEVERRAILDIHLRKRGVDPAEMEGLDAAVEGSGGYCGAEIESGVKDALIEAFVVEGEITGALIAEQLSNMVPLSEAFAEQFATMSVWAEQNARPASLEPGPKVRKRKRTTQAVGTGKRDVDIDN
jgi:AAA+ superfamily predicted ATPase